MMLFMSKRCSKTITRTVQQNSKFESTSTLINENRTVAPRPKKFNKNLLINEQTTILLNELDNEKSVEGKYNAALKFQNHLLKYPDTRITALHNQAVKQVNDLKNAISDETKLQQLRITAALLGSVPKDKSGIRILSFDGGGSRGVVSLEIIREIEHLTNKRIYELFDYISGVSTGAILAWMLGLKLDTVDEAANQYRKFSQEIFNQNRLIGTGKLMLSHAYYDTFAYQEILKDMFGEKILIETAANENVPKCCAVSTLVNRHILKPYVWRNYSIATGAFDTHWPGTCRSEMWEAIYASSAAPGYFEEFKYGDGIHQDGGILTNNPTGVALNECRLLWPDSPIKCVVSISTGRYDPIVGPTTTEFLSLKNKVLKIVDSATETNEVHNILYELLPKHTYFRFNPYIQEPIFLDENRPEKLDLLVSDTRRYIERNQFKFRKCSAALLK